MINSFERMMDARQEWQKSQDNVDREFYYDMRDVFFKELLGKTGTKSSKDLLQKKGKKSPIEPTETMLKIGSWFGRRKTNPWMAKELKVLKSIGEIPKEDIKVMDKYYGSNCQYKRKDVMTLLNNWTGELDRARAFIPETPQDDLIADFKKQWKKMQQATEGWYSKEEINAFRKRVWDAVGKDKFKEVFE